MKPHLDKIVNKKFINTQNNVRNSLHFYSHLMYNFLKYSYNYLLSVSLNYRRWQDGDIFCCNSR